MQIMDAMRVAISKDKNKQIIPVGVGRIVLAMALPIIFGGA
jgi:hypothetical protein